MSNFILGLFLSLLLISCNNISKKWKNDLAENNGNNKISELAERLNGIWISESYLDEIEMSKSIYLSRNYKTQIIGFRLDEANLVTDSAILGGFTDHEGGYTSPLKYDSIKNEFINDLSKISDYATFPNPFDLHFDGNKHIGMYFPDSKRTDVYRKVNPDFQTEVRGLLTAGLYTTQYDSTIITLSADGEVKNFYGFKYYELAEDFTEGIEYDAIIFFNSLDGGNWSQGDVYKFEVLPNSLLLQHVDIDWDTLDDNIVSNDTIALLKHN
jgi:hypothetical protein